MLTKSVKHQRRLFSRANRDIPSMFKDLRNHGFLPSLKPLIHLPKQFEALDQISKDLTLYQPDGSEGLLMKNQLRKTVDRDFPNLTTEVMKVDPNDARLNSALWRDYTILGATYLLEPCHLSFLETNNYGRGMGYLPENLAVPMKILADRLHYKQPILDYAQAYSLNNWKLRNDPNPEDPNYHND